MLACCFVRACKHLVSACACACHFSSGIAVIISCQYLYFCTSKSSKLGTCLADLFALLLPYCMQVGGFQYYQYVYFCTSKASQLRTCLLTYPAASPSACRSGGRSTMSSIRRYIQAQHQRWDPRETGYRLRKTTTNPHLMVLSLLALLVQNCKY